MLAAARSNIEPPKIISVALLGSLVAPPAAAQTPAASSPEPAAPPAPPPPVPQPVEPQRQRPVQPTPPPPKPTPSPTPRPVEQPVTPPPQPVQEPAPAVSETTSAVAESAAASTQTAASNNSSETGSSAGGAARGDPSGAENAVTEPSSSASYLNNPKPPYPQASRRMMEEGTVILRVLVSAQGKANRVEIKVSSGFARLDQSARQTVQNWRFVPAKRGNTPIDMWYDVPVNFSLRNP